MRKLSSPNHDHEIKIEFPGWEKLLEITMSDYLRKDKTTGIEIRSCSEDIIAKLKTLKSVLSNFHPSKVLESVPLVIPEIDESLNQEYLNTIIKKATNEWTGHNEFYVLFDIKKCDYVYVDKRIKEVLGIEPEMFNIKSISALQDDCPLYHPDDISHVIRFALLALLSMSLPFLRWNAFKEHYIARYRIGTTMSSIPQLRKKGHVVINKLCYAFHHPLDLQPAAPRYHIDRYYVFSDEKNEHPTRSFVSDFDQTIFINMLNYIFNAYLIGLSPKYVCMLEERRTSDRNKAVANAMNEHMKSAKALDNEFDELQVANCFSKTIRSKIESAMNESDRFFSNKNIHIQGDQEAVYYATRLGLLPMPEKIKDTIYHNVRKIF